MDDKLYTPEVIVENPFPGDVVQPITTSTPTGVGTYTPTTNKETVFPKKRTAVELLSTALNTRSRKILEEFKLVQSGAIQIGNFEDGETGDLRLTPNGLTARNISGLTTFAIDGTTGDAIFLGTIRAGTVIATTIDGDLILADTIDGSKIITNTLDADRIKASTIDVAVDVGTGTGFVRLDGANNRILVNDGTNNRIVIGNI